MPDITLPYLPTMGAATSATGFNSDVYAPAASPASLEVINGWLGTSNRDGSWRVPYYKIRPESMVRADSVGATANQDYFLLTFPSSSDAEGAFFAIPGAAKGCYVDKASGMILVSASLVEANSIDRNTITDGFKFRLYYKAPTDTGYTTYPPSQQQGCACDDGSARKAYFDRQYCWDFMVVSPAVGQWEFFIGIWATGAYATLSGLHSIRVRCRTMSTLYIP